MKSTRQLEEAVLNLPAAERAHLALAAWESLEHDPAFWADAGFDPEGIALALERDREMESGSLEPLPHETFRRLTSGAAK